jgi:hypothetical protein
MGLQKLLLLSKHSSLAKASIANSLLQKLALLSKVSSIVNCKRKKN